MKHEVDVLREEDDAKDDMIRTAEVVLSEKNKDLTI